MAATAVKPFGQFVPELRIGPRRITAEAGANLLDTLLAAGEKVPWSCRSGQCQTCLVQARPDQVPAQAAANLDVERQRAGWLLSCQCAIQQDMDLHLHDPATDGLSAEVVSIDYLAERIIRLRVQPQKPLRYKPGQHLVLWVDEGIGRPYSIASRPAERYLEFHIRLHENGAASTVIQHLTPGQAIFIGAPAGHFHYDPDWQDRPLLMLARGTGLAPLQAMARAAVDSGHTAQIDLWHWSSEGKCYLLDELEAWAAQHPQVALHWRPSADIDGDLRKLRLASRATMALVCGSPDFIEQVRKPLFMAGLPGRQIIDEAFLHPNK